MHPSTSAGKRKLTDYYGPLHEVDNDKSKHARVDRCPNFRWISSAPMLNTCLHGVNGEPRFYPQVAAFDLDGTIIKSPFDKGSRPKFGTSWSWWNSRVPRKLRELHEKEYSIVIISNQALNPKMLVQWKQKVTSLARAIPDIPFTLFAATAKDSYRKPAPGMWTRMESLFEVASISIDKDRSFFVGDAAGRKGDFSDSDKGFADAVGLSFQTPEVHHLLLKYVTI